MGVDGIEIMYNYTGAFAATPEAQSMDASWYQNGTEVIFGCGGAVGNSVMAAAEEKSAKVIGVDVDQSYESDTVITSAMKQLSVSVYDGVRDFYAGSLPGRQDQHLLCKERRYRSSDGDLQVYELHTGRLRRGLLSVKGWQDHSRTAF